MLRHKDTIFREKKMPVLKNNCRWKAVIYKVHQSDQPRGLVVRAPDY